MEDKKNGRGGRRAGAGRPKGDSRIYSFRCPGALAEKIDSLENKTGFIKQALSNAFDKADYGIRSLGQVAHATNITPMRLPFYEQRVVAGFPIPLDNDERSQDIEVLSLLCPHPESSYLIRVKGDSMIDAGIESGDIVIVDKSNRNPSPKEIAVCELNGEYTLKHFEQKDGQGWLIPANPAYPKFRVNEGDDFSIWGTVTYIIHKARD